MKTYSKKGEGVKYSGTLHRKENALEAVKKFITEKLYNPYNVNLAIKERDNRLLIDCGFWRISIDMRDGWFNVSTLHGCGIGYHDLDQVVDIRDNIDTIIEIYNRK